MKKSKSILGIILAVTLALGVLGVTSGFTYAPETQQSAVTVSQIEQALPQPDDGIMPLGISLGPIRGGVIGDTGPTIHTPLDGPNFGEASAEVICYADSTYATKAMFKVLAYKGAYAKESDGTNLYYVSFATEFTVAPTSDFKVTHFTVSLHYAEDITGESHLKSDIKTTVSIGGSIGTSLGMSGNVSYSFDGSGLNITNSFYEMHKRSWITQIMSPKLNEAIIIKPSIEIKTTHISDYIYLTFDSITLQDNKDKKYEIKPRPNGLRFGFYPDSWKFYSELTTVQ